MSPICFHIGSRPVYWYGVMLALAFLAAIGHWQVLTRRTGKHDMAFASDLAFWLMVGGIVGARVAYVVANIDYFRAAPLEIIRVDQGGLIYYGGLIGASIVFVGFARVHRTGILDLADFAITALPLGHALGRIGCFLNGCCQGRLAEGAGWAALGLDRYPVQLYEAAFNGFVYGLLFRQYLRRDANRPGLILAAYLLVYPAGRFVLEFMRGDERLRFGALSAAQYLSLILMATGLGLWWVLRRSHATVHCNT